MLVRINGADGTSFYYACNHQEAEMFGFAYFIRWHMLVKNRNGFWIIFGLHYFKAKKLYLSFHLVFDFLRSRFSFLVKTKILW